MRFYQELCRGRPGPLLELGCGTGRVTYPLLRQGHDVVGLDLDAGMLKRCAERLEWAGRRVRGRVQLVHGDMRALPLAGPFDRVLCPFNAFMHLYRHQDVVDCLAAVRRVLAPTEGRFVFDILKPDLRWLARDPRKRWAKTRFRHPVTKRRFLYSTNHRYDEKRQLLHVRIYYDCLDDKADSYEVLLTHRHFFPQELRYLLETNGFAIEAEYGDFDGGHFESDSESQILMCRPR